MYTFVFSSSGMNEALSISTRMLSTPVLDAASISTMSRLPPSLTAQAAHLPQGLPSTGERQFTARANILAVLVLPVPRVPQNR